MRDELQEKIFNKFPNLYSQRFLSNKETCMCYGIACGDGWFNIIFDLSKELTSYSKTVQATQVKEKFGYLRFYVNEYDDTIMQIITKFENKSKETCRKCGNKKDFEGKGRGKDCKDCLKNI